MSLDGKSCTIILVQLPPNHDRGVKGLEGVLELRNGAIHLRPKDSENPVVIPPHLLDRFEPVTDELREGFEIDFQTEFCLRAYYNGRRRLRTLGWNAVLAQATAAPPVE
jgi:hypothetical protein